MRIVCPSCSAKYNLDDSRVPPQGASIKCPKCKHSFIVKPDAASPLPPPLADPPVAAPPPPPAAPPPAETATTVTSLPPAPADAPIPLPGQGMMGETRVTSAAPETSANTNLADTVSGRVAHASDAIPLPGHGLMSPPTESPDDDSAGISMDDLFGEDAMSQPPTDPEDQDSTSIEELADIFGGGATPPSGASFVSLSTEGPATSGDGDPHGEHDDIFAQEDPLEGDDIDMDFDIDDDGDEGMFDAPQTPPPAEVTHNVSDGVLDFIDQEADSEMVDLGHMFTVRTNDDNEIGPIDTHTVMEMLKAGEVFGGEQISSDGGLSWTVLAQVSPFAEEIQRAKDEALAGLEMTAEDVGPAGDIAQESGGPKRLIALVATIVLVLTAGVLAEFTTDYGWFVHRLFTGQSPEQARILAELQEEVVQEDLPKFRQEPLALIEADSYPLYREGLKDSRRILNEGKKIFAKAKKRYDAKVALLDDDQVRPPEPKMNPDALHAAAQMGRFASLLFSISKSATFKKEMNDALEIKKRYKAEASWMWGTIMAAVHYSNGNWDKGLEVLKPITDPQSKQPPEGLTEAHFWAGYGYLQKERYEKAIQSFDRALQSDPSRVLPQYYQAITLLKMEKLKAAEGYARKILEQQSDHRRANLFLADLQIKDPERREDGMAMLKKLSEGSWADDMAPMHRADAFLSRARVRQSEHEYPEALIYLEQAAQQAPSREDILLMFANLALKMLDYKKAISAFERVRKINPKNVDAIEGILISKLSKGDNEGAFKDAAASVKKMPKEARLHFWFGMIAKKTLRLDLAAKEFQAASELDPRYPGPAVENILDKMARGIYKKAIDEGQKALTGVQEISRPAIRTSMAAVLVKQRRYQEAREQLTTAIKEDENHLDAWVRLIDLMRILGEVENVEKLKAGLLKRDPRGYRSHIAKGMLEFAHNDYDSAIDEFELAYKLTGDNYEILLWSAEAALKQDDPGKAKTYVDHAFSLRPKSPTVHEMRGIVERVTDPKKSARTLIEGIEITKEDPHLPYQLGLSYNAMGAYLEAVDAFEAAIQLAPDFANAHYNKGLALKDLNRTTSAIAAFRETIKIESDRPDAHLRIAEVLTGMGDAPGALRAFKGAINAAPRESEARCKMGENLIVRLGDHPTYFRRGVRMMERCVMMDKKYPGAFKYLGHAYRQLSQYKKAIAAYRKHLSTNPYDLENEMVREYLEEMGAETSVVDEFEEDEALMGENRTNAPKWRGVPGQVPSQMGTRPAGAGNWPQGANGQPSAPANGQPASNTTGQTAPANGQAPVPAPAPTGNNPAAAPANPTN